MFTKEIIAKVVGFKSYNIEKEGKEYNIKYANIVYNDTENKYLEGDNVGTYKYNDNKINLEIEKIYNLLLIGQKVNEKYYYEIIGATRLDK